ncbi:hypothetical protein [Thauera sinica]|uniref:Lipoprotein n=1 Tax=Thauera sinica TaxID=2665146 RepID=A0ABW1AYF2_9RHOO|nr:hypothetical protein [Thauera sp. K11]
MRDALLRAARAGRLCKAGSPSRSDRASPIRPRLVVAGLFLALLQGCAVVAVADATVTVAATAVKAGAAVTGMAVDAVAAGVDAATGGDDDGKEE